MKPVLLDICCRQGGASKGYQDAGFYVIGVDIEPQPKHKGDEFICADGLEVLRALIADQRALGVHISAIHTSWPCQGYSITNVIMKGSYPKLIEHGRELLQEIGLPYVQENVESPETLAVMKDPVLLCGQQFGLNTYRHRLFESNLPLPVPEHQEHTRTAIKMGRALQEGDLYQAIGNFSNVDYVRRDMKVPWMTREGIRECIPPVYAEYIGRQIMEMIK